MRSSRVLTLCFGVSLVAVSFVAARPDVLYLNYEDMKSDLAARTPPPRRPAATLRTLPHPRPLSARVRALNPPCALQSAVQKIARFLELPLSAAQVRRPAHTRPGAHDGFLHAGLCLPFFEPRQ